MADPAAVVLAHVEVVVVAELEAGVAELAVAAVGGLLGELQVAPQVRVLLLRRVYL